MGCAEYLVFVSPEGQGQGLGGQEKRGMAFLQISQLKFADRTTSTISAPTALLSSRCVRGGTPNLQPQSTPSPRVSPGRAPQVPPAGKRKAMQPPSSLGQKANLRNAASNSLERWQALGLGCSLHRMAWWAHLQIPGLSRASHS